MYDAIYDAICDSELDCADWDSTVQHQLTTEVVQSIIQHLKDTLPNAKPL